VWPFDKIFPTDGRFEILSRLSVVPEGTWHFKTVNICSCMASSSLFLIDRVHTRSVNNIFRETVPQVGDSMREEVLSHGRVVSQFFKFIVVALGVGSCFKF
jgi:hypothetical protein